ncbi:hypothetical protein GF357_00055 [Candidatus Dojkabacteria bacterium]|nr:hypothetical protein [Candidatus Dojkabacteria bacterium]
MSNTSMNKWNLKEYYQSVKDKQIDEDFEIVKQQNEKFIKKWKNRKDYLENPEILKLALDEYEKLESDYGVSGKPGYYLGLKSYLDQDDLETKAKLNSIHRQAIKLLNEIEFFELRLSKVSSTNQKIFLESNKLKDYKHFLENLFKNAKYLLSEPEEKIMNIKSKTSHSNWVSMVSRFLSKEERKVLDEDGKVKIKNFGQIIGLMNSQQQKVRDSAAQAFHKINTDYAEVAENELNSIFENKQNNDEIRGYDYPEQSRHLADDIETEIVNTMVSTVTDNFQIPQNYYKAKAKLMGKRKLKYHERNVPYGKNEKKYSFKEAAELISDVFHGLDPEFGEIFEKLLNDSRIDVFPVKNKVSGAFCIHDIKTLPTHILLNYNKKLDDVKTLAHETGHAINNELMKKAQNSLNFSSPLSTAEVASTFFEDFVLEKLLESATKEQKLVISLDKLNDDVSSIFRQVAAYNFEKELHKSFRNEGYLGKSFIGNIFQKHMSSYMGKYVSQDKGSENWWVYWSHFRRFFYVYSYASGLLISKALQSMVRDDSDAIDLVKSVLAAGSSASPKDTFSSIGIDISHKNFWKAGIDEVERRLNDLAVA